MKKLLVVLAGVVVLLAAATAPSSAEAVEKLDSRGDAPARVDIARVTYRNMPQRAAAHIVVPELVRDGSAAIIVANPGTDWGYVAIVRITPDGSLRKRFVLTNHDGEYPRSCLYKAVWNAAANYIDISVPRSCLAGLGSTLYLQAATGMGKDYAPPAYHLLQG